MVRTGDSIRAAVEALAEREAAFAKVVERHGIPEPRRSDPGAHTLLRTIVGQQVSVAAARSMWAKLEAAYGAPPELAAILEASDEELRAAGISRQKAGYARSLAELVLSGELDRLLILLRQRMQVELLTRIKGIGRWSAEIYLLFAEGRPDIWPAGDLAVQAGIGKILALPERPSEKETRALADPWSPHRGAAAILTWHCYNNAAL